MNLENKVKNRFNISEMLKSLLLKVAKLEKNNSTQVNSDWNATSGVAQILNKPTIPDVSSYTKMKVISFDFFSTIGATTSPTVFPTFNNTGQTLQVSKLQAGLYSFKINGFTPGSSVQSCFKFSGTGDTAMFIGSSIGTSDFNTKTQVLVAFYNTSGALADPAVNQRQANVLILIPTL